MYIYIELIYTYDVCAARSRKLTSYVVIRPRGWQMFRLLSLNAEDHGFVPMSYDTTFVDAVKLILAASPLTTQH